MKKMTKALLLFFYIMVSSSLCILHGAQASAAQLREEAKRVRIDQQALSDFKAYLKETNTLYDAAYKYLVKIAENQGLWTALACRYLYANFIRNRALIDAWSVEPIEKEKADERNLRLFNENLKKALSTRGHAFGSEEELFQKAECSEDFFRALMALYIVRAHKTFRARQLAVDNDPAAPVSLGIFAESASVCMHCFEPLLGKEVLKFNCGHLACRECFDLGVQELEIYKPSSYSCSDCFLEDVARAEGCSLFLS